MQFSFSQYPFSSSFSSTAFLCLITTTNIYWMPVSTRPCVLNARENMWKKNWASPSEGQTLNKNHTNKRNFSLQYELWNKLMCGKQGLCTQVRFELKGTGKASLKKWHLDGDLEDKQGLFWRRMGRSVFQLRRQHYCEDLTAGKKLGLCRLVEQLNLKKSLGERQELAMQEPYCAGPGLCRLC